MTARQRQRATIPWGAPSSVANVFDAWANIEALEWQIDATCRDLDPEMFFLQARRPRLGRGKGSVCSVSGQE